jgi:major membrane immunogen (membrane-anchored lipoprotein)
MKNTIFVLISIILLTACRDKDPVDVAVPAFDFVHVNDSLSNEYEVLAGQTITIQVKASDNVELRQLKMEIHPAEDGHTHDGEGTQGGEDSPNVGSWAYSDIVNLSGTTETRTWTLTVPDSIGGHWHCEFLLIDHVGNESAQYVTTLIIENPDLPVITGTTTPAAVNGEITIVIGDILYVSGTTDDPDGIVDVNVWLQNESGNIVGMVDVPANGSTGVDFSNLTFDQATAGHYKLIIQAFDTNGFEGRWGTELHVQ